MGSGFRTFTAGEVLTASNVQNYLQDQVVMTFAGSAARSSAIGTANFEEGMTSYLTDTDKMEVYNGTNWVSVAPTTTQGLTLINTTSFSGVASQSFNDVFSATYDNYFVIGTLIQSTSTTFSLRNRVGGVDASGTDYDVMVVDGATPTTTSTSSLTLSPSGDSPVAFRMDIISPFEALRTKFFYEGLQGLNTNQRRGAATHDLTTSYDGFTLLTGSGTFLSGSKVSIYGLAK